MAMRPGDEPIGRAPRGDFPSTRWSRILADGGDSRRPDWDALARAYAHPIAEWLRFALRDADAADDAAQEFFVWMMESGFTSRADPSRGRFRAFLKTALRHFVVDRARRESARKRGGDRTAVPLDEAEAPKGPAPDEALDAAWRAALVGRALDLLERELVAAGKEAYFRVFRDYFLGAEPGVTHAHLADRHRIPVTDVSNYLRVAKRWFREILRREILSTVSTPEDLGSELAWVFLEDVP